MPRQAFTKTGQTASFNGDDNFGYAIRGVKVTFDITAVPGVDTVLLTIQGKDNISGKYYTILAGVAEVGIATRIYTVYPGMVAAANVVANDVIPDDYRVTVTHSGAGAFNYTIGIDEVA